MERFRLLDLDGSGQKIFCTLMQLAINDFVQKEFGNNDQSTKFKIDPLFVTKVYEKLKAMKINGIEGQQIQEFLITSILKYYLEQAHPDSAYRLAFPNDKSDDSIIIESPKEMEFKKLGGDKILPTQEVTVYHFQIKEVREEADFFKSLSKGIVEAKEERMVDTGLFMKFRGYFNNKILKKDYSGTILLLFLRAPSYMSFNTQEITAEFRKLNGGYFKNIWFIASVDRLIDKDGKELTVSQKQGMNFHFYVKELIDSDPDWFTVVNMGCEFKKFYLSQDSGSSV